MRNKFFTGYGIGLVLSLMFWLVIISFVVVADRWCYQEDSLTYTCNTTTQIKSGAENMTGSWVARQTGAAIYDSNWGSYGQDANTGSSSSAWVYYAEPTLLENESIATANTLWQIKGTTTATPILISANVTIKISGSVACRPLGDYFYAFQIESYDAPNLMTESYNSWKCWNGSTYYMQKQWGSCSDSSGCSRAYEEGVWWYIRKEPSYNLTVDCKTSDGNCTGNVTGFYTKTPKTFNITATPNVGYTFNKWKDDSSFCTVYNETEPITNVTITEGNCKVTAEFNVSSTGCDTTQIYMFKNKKHKYFFNCDLTVFFRTKNK